MYVVQVFFGQRDATFYKTFFSEYLLTEPCHAYSCQVLNKRTTAHGLNSNYWLKQKWNSKLQPKSDNVRAHERLNYLQNILKLIMLGPTIGYLHQVSLSYFFYKITFISQFQPTLCAKLYGFVLVRDQNSEILQNKLWRLGVKEDSECSTFR
jgi:hypothetical protein